MNIHALIIMDIF